jgi:uncharacterized repeat protein (TIGR01451 family)
VGAFEAYSLGDMSIASIDANPDPQSLGGNVTYNIVANNDGPDAINQASVTNPLPADTTFVSGSPNCSATAGVVTCALGTMNAQQVKLVKVTVHPGHTGNYTDVATIGAPGITDTNSSNDSASVQNSVLTAAQQQVLGEQVTGFQGMGLVVKAPKVVTLSQFLNGFNVQAYCTKEQCLRHFREHAAINSGIVRIAGYNLAVFRGTLPLTSAVRTIKLVPCVSGSGHSHPNRRCHGNLARAAGKFAPFKLKVVVAAVDRNGHKAYAKRFLRVKP